MDKLPDSARRYFWEVKFDEIDPSKNARYVIERLLEYGDFPELRWMFKNFEQGKIIEILKVTGKLSRRRASAWANYFDVSRSEIQCLKKPSQKQHVTTWNY